jgi:hypothetical protein
MHTKRAIRHEFITLFDTKGEPFLVYRAMALDVHHFH